MIRFVLILLALLAVLSGIVLLGHQWGWWPDLLFWKEILFFLFFVTLIIGYNLQKIRRRQPRVFIQFYMLSIVLKMVVGLAFIFVLVWKVPVETRPSTALFMIGYALFTGVEVFFLVRSKR